VFFFSDKMDFLMKILILSEIKNMNYNYKVNNLEDGTCCRWIKFQIEKNESGKYIVKNIEFLGGCQGNQKAISTLLDGSDVDYIISKLENITCGTKRDSCSSELCKGLKEAIKVLENDNEQS